MKKNETIVLIEGEGIEEEEESNVETEILSKEQIEKFKNIYNKNVIIDDEIFILFILYYYYYCYYFVWKIAPIFTINMEMIYTYRIFGSKSFF